MDFEQNVVHITIFGAFSKIEGDAPWQDVYDCCSYKVVGAEYSKAYRRGLWNGKTYLINKKTQSFPSGLVDLVREVCEEAGKEVFTHDNRVDPGSMAVYGKGSFDLEGITMTGKYSYQLEIAKTAVKEKRGILSIATNGGKTEIAAAIINYLQLPTLFVVPSKELLYQTRDRFLKRIPNTDKSSVGVVGDGEWSPGSWITVALMPTLESRLQTLECQELLEKTDVLFLDEAHVAGSTTWYEVASTCQAYYRYGMSGSALCRTDGADLRLLGLVGGVIASVNNKQLVKLGVSPKAKIVFDKITKPSLAGGKINYNTAYTEGVVKNTYLTEKIVEWTKICVDQGLSVLILIDQIQHGKLLDAALWNVQGAFIPHTFISGQADDKENRKEGFEAFDKREIPVLLSSSILDVGISTDSIDVLICAGSRKSKIKTLQRLGRALRGNKAIVIEFANYCNKFLLEHSLTRLRDYKAEDCFDIIQSGPDKELIKRLWAGESK